MFVLAIISWLAVSSRAEVRARETLACAERGLQGCTRACRAKTARLYSPSPVCAPVGARAHLQTPHPSGGGWRACLRTKQTRAHRTRARTHASTNDLHARLAQILDIADEESLKAEASKGPVFVQFLAPVGPVRVCVCVCVCVCM